MGGGGGDSDTVGTLAPHISNYGFNAGPNEECISCYVDQLVSTTSCLLLTYSMLNSWCFQLRMTLMKSMTFRMEATNPLVRILEVTVPTL